MFSAVVLSASLASCIILDHGYVSKVIQCCCTDITYVIAKAEFLDFLFAIGRAALPPPCMQLTYDIRLGSPSFRSVLCALHSSDLV